VYQLPTAKMSSNSSSSTQSPQTLGSSDIVAITALIISIGALMTTVLQVLQQYLASAEGFRRCAPSVIGLWASKFSHLENIHEMKADRK
jgi:hypothetical protein